MGLARVDFGKLRGVRSGVCARGRSGGRTRAACRRQRGSSEVSFRNGSATRITAQCRWSIRGTIGTLVHLASATAVQHQQSAGSCPHRIPGAHPVANFRTTLAPDVAPLSGGPLADVASVGCPSNMLVERLYLRYLARATARQTESAKTKTAAPHTLPFQGLGQQRGA